jgi:release factor glutamine methyltransferase
MNLTESTDAHSLAHLLRWACRVLAASPTAALDAALLLAHTLQQPRSFLLANMDLEPAVPVVVRYQELIKRRSGGEPIAYITGAREFWSLDLRITPAVLVPRPETELLVERALALHDSSPALVADLGTGSGAVALSCASERPRWKIVATDVATDALALASANAAALGLNGVEFRAGSWYEALPDPEYDLILSNPPYIASDDPALADPALRCEPQLALVSGADGLTALRQIIGGAWERLKRGGALALEHGATQGPAVAQLLVKAGFSHVRCHPDLAGLDRVTEAHKE